MHKVAGFFHSHALSSDEGGDRLYALHFEAASRQKELMCYLAIKAVPLRVSSSLICLSLCFSHGHHHGFQPLEQRNLSPVHVKSRGRVLGMEPREQTLVRQGERMVF